MLAPSFRTACSTLACSERLPAPAPAGSFDLMPALPRPQHGHALASCFLVSAMLCPLWRPPP